MTAPPKVSHKHHFIYKTVCVPTGRYYVGRHSTNNLNDAYKGSGVQISRSIKKYGADAHVRQIIATAVDHDSLIQLERSLVNEELLKDPLCMNLTVGGYGDFYHVTDEIRSVVCAQNGRKNGPKNILATRAPEVRRKARMTMQERYGKGTTLLVSPMKGKQQTQSAKDKIRASKIGRIWMTNGVTLKCVKAENQSQMEALGFRRGQK